MNSLPASLSSRGLLDIQIVAIDRSAAIKCRWLPQNHDWGVTNLQHMKTNRRTLEDKFDNLKNVGINLESENCNWPKQKEHIFEMQFHCILIF